MSKGFPMGLDEHLQAESSVGDLDSQGSFTVNLELARRKLREYQTRDDTFFVLKVIQAMICGGAKEIRISAQRQFLSILAKGDVTTLAEFEADSVASALTLSPYAQGKDGPLFHLMAAIFALELVGEEEIQWGHLGKKLVIGSSSTSRDERRHGGSSFALLGRDCRAVKSRVAGRCRQAAVPIFWNSTQINGTEMIAAKPADVNGQYDLAQTRIRKGPEENGVALYCERDQDVTGETVFAPATKNLPYLKYVGNFDDLSYMKVQTPIPGPSAFSRITPSILRLWGVLILPGGSGEMGRLLVIKSGVRLNPVKLDLGFPGAVCFVDGRNLNTDLSEFEVVRDERFEALLAEIRERVLELVRGCRESLTDGSTRLPRDTSSILYMGQALVFTCVQPWTLPYLGFTIYRWRKNKKERPVTALAKLEQSESHLLKLLGNSES